MHGSVWEKYLMLVAHSSRDGVAHKKDTYLLAHSIGDGGAH